MTWPFDKSSIADLENLEFTYSAEDGVGRNWKETQKAICDVFEVEYGKSHPTARSAAHGLRESLDSFSRDYLWGLEQDRRPILIDHSWRIPFGYYSYELTWEAGPCEWAYSFVAILANHYRQEKKQKISDSGPLSGLVFAENWIVKFEGPYSLRFYNRHCLINRDSMTKKTIKYIDKYLPTK
tara:strand:- start:903 stop:1448 length:546 start_codon:yes stop_codon:yes gene_type:complete